MPGNLGLCCHPLSWPLKHEGCWSGRTPSRVRDSFRHVPREGQARAVQEERAKRGGRFVDSSRAAPKRKQRQGGPGKGHVPAAACTGRGPDCWKSPASVCQGKGGWDTQLCPDSPAGERPCSSCRFPPRGEEKPQLVNDTVKKKSAIDYGEKEAISCASSKSTEVQLPPKKAETMDSLKYL